MTTLLHICCGPCATATVDHFRDAGHDLRGFFYNPNIHPFLEFRRRLSGARDLATDRMLPMEEDLHYDPAEWFALVGSRGDDRCAACIGLRLRRTAARAASTGCDAFTTSLAISPWQDHDAIQAGGRAAAAEHEVTFVYEDLRPLYRASRKLAKAAGLYRQQYCGCVLSEWERYRDR